MNEFLEKHSYFIEKRGRQIIIHHKSIGYGCIHIIFIFLSLIFLALSAFQWFFVLFLIPVVLIYANEVEKRRKHSNQTILDFDDHRFYFNAKKKQRRTYYFENASSVVTTSEHIGGYASADRTTTEEYRREINVLFNDGDILTIFSFVSDYEEAEPEVGSLVKWLERLLNVG